MAGAFSKQMRCFPVFWVELGTAWWLGVHGGVRRPDLTCAGELCHSPRRGLAPLQVSHGLTFPRFSVQVQNKAHL